MVPPSPTSSECSRLAVQARDLQHAGEASAHVRAPTEQCWHRQRSQHWRPDHCGLSACRRNVSRVVTSRHVLAQRSRPSRYRKELRIRPGFTPEEDVTRFRSARQQEADSRALPKGSVVGMARPEVAVAKAALQTMSSTQRKNAKRKEKRKEDRLAPGLADDVPESWDGGDDNDGPHDPAIDSTNAAAGPQARAPDVAQSPGKIKSRPTDDAASRNAAALLLKSALRPSGSSGAPPPTSQSKAAPATPAASSQSASSAVTADARNSTALPPRRPGPGLFDKALGEATGGDKATQERKARALRKKLQQVGRARLSLFKEHCLTSEQAQVLRERQEAGESLLQEQEEKANSLAALQRELDALSVEA